VTLQRLIVTFKPEETIIHALYRSSLDGPNPNTKARGKEVSKLIRSGLEDALGALDGKVDLVGCSGFTTREDVLLAISSPDADKLVKGA